MVLVQVVRAARQLGELSALSELSRLVLDLMNLVFKDTCFYIYFTSEFWVGLLCIRTDSTVATVPSVHPHVHTR